MMDSIQLKYLKRIIQNSRKLILEQNKFFANLVWLMKINGLYWNSADRGAKTKPTSMDSKLSHGSTFPLKPFNGIQNKMDVKQLNEQQFCEFKLLCKKNLLFFLIITKQFNVIEKLFKTSTFLTKMRHLFALIRKLRYFKAKAKKRKLLILAQYLSNLESYFHLLHSKQREEYTHKTPAPFTHNQHTFFAPANRCKNSIEMKKEQRKLNEPCSFHFFVERRNNVPKSDDDYTSQRIHSIPPK